MSTSGSEVLTERSGRTMVVTLNRPEARNSLTKNVVLALAAALEGAAADTEVRCVVLTGAGGHFCAGADLRRTFAEDPDIMDHLDEYMDAFHSLIRAIVRCPKPTIAQMDGAAVGFGADMALACDLRIASSTAYLQEKFVNIGLMPDGGGTFWLPRLVGTARALKAMLLSDKLEAKELDALGLLTSVVAPAELRSATMALAKRIEDGPPLAYAALKSAVYGSLGDLEAALKREREGQLRLLRSQDCIEGIMAWSQKRPPDFKGQ
ncbi:MAG TPA: enoyl-CoA hydratase-related protein [Labilithrix sp.]|nr:enoyl-CoA hydratase-related protein [Labilithrix sp.]